LDKKLANKVSAYYTAKKKALVISHKKVMRRKREKFLVIRAISESSIKFKQISLSLCHLQDGQVLLTYQKKIPDTSPEFLSLLKYSSLSNLK